MLVVFNESQTIVKVWPEQREKRFFCVFYLEMAMVQDTPGARAPGKISGVETSKRLLFRLNPGIKGRLMRTPVLARFTVWMKAFFLFLEKKMATNLSIVGETSRYCHLQPWKSQLTSSFFLSVLYFFPVELAKCKTWSVSLVWRQDAFLQRVALKHKCVSQGAEFFRLLTKSGMGPSYVRVHNLQPPPPPSILALASTFPRCCQISESPGQVLAFQNNSNVECHCSGTHKWWKPSSFSHYFFFAPHTGVPNSEPCTLMMSLVEQSRAASWSVQRTTGNKRLPSINAGACRKDGWSESL